MYPGRRAKVKPPKTQLRGTKGLFVSLGLPGTILATLGCALAAVALAGCGGNGHRGAAAPSVREPVAPGAVRALAAARALDLVGGPEATGRTGDFVIENAVARFVVQGPGPARSQIGMFGGVVLDADLERGATAEGRDGLRIVAPMAGLYLFEPDTVILEDDGTGGEAVVRAEGPARPFGLIARLVGLDDSLDVRATTRYVLRPDVRYLEIETTYAPEPGARLPLPLVGDVLVWEGGVREFAPGAGFDIPGFAAGPVIVGVGDGASYGLGQPQSAGDLLYVSISGTDIVLWRIDDLARGEPLRVTRYLIVGDGSADDVLRTWREIRGEAAAEVSGRAAGEITAEAPLELLVEDAGGAFASHRRLVESGPFSLRLPPGAYRLTAAPGPRRDFAPVEFEVAAGASKAIDAFDVGAAGRIRLEVREGNTLIPAKIDLDDGLGPRHAARGDETIHARPGTWRYTVSRGFEYTVAMGTVDVPDDGTPATLQVTLDRVVDTSGYVCGDLHLHSAKSNDASISVGERVRSLLAAGLDFAVASDHDALTDYGPTLRALGGEPWLRTFVGTEVSATHFGHFNGFPLRVDSAAPVGGAIDWSYRTPSEVFDAIRARSPDAAVQLNHPRDGPTSFFNAIGFDPATARPARPPDAPGLNLPPETDLNDFGFDAVEVFNTTTRESIDAALRDYLGLLAAGRRFALTGTSDSHSAGRPPGSFRTCVLSPTDAPAEIVTSALLAALRAGRATVSGGPFVTVEVAGEAAVGREIVAPAGEVAVRVRIQAPPWMDVETLRVYVGDRTALERAVAPSEAVVRFDEALPLTVPDGAAVVVEALGSRSLAPVGSGAPRSATNPLWVRHESAVD